MIEKEEINEILSSYNKEKITIGTLCSHSALQIFYGAKQEGFRTLGICTNENMKSYTAFTAAKPDLIYVIEDPVDVLEEKCQEFLRNHNTIIIPTGSFVEYVKPKNLEEKFLVPMQGNRKVLAWEGDRKKQKKWLETGGVKLPKEYASPSEIDGLCIVKFHGAKGGREFFLTNSENGFYKGMKKKKKEFSETEIKNFTIQEYIFGVRFYPHFHYSPLDVERGLEVDNGYLELLGYDQRIESNIDELHRTGLSRKEREKLNIEESFSVVGNRPVIPREKMEVQYYTLGKKIVGASLMLFSPGILGSFCPETICTKDLEIFVFEISARIVAGTNIWSPQGSPEAWYIWGEPMSMGRRIARELKIGIKKDELEKIIY